MQTHTQLSFYYSFFLFFFFSFLFLYIHKIKIIKIQNYRKDITQIKNYITAPKKSRKLLGRLLDHKNTGGASPPRATTGKQGGSVTASSPIPFLVGGRKRHLQSQTQAVVFNFLYFTYLFSFSFCRSAPGALPPPFSVSGDQICGQGVCG